MTQRRVLVAAAVIVLLLAGCGSSSKKATTTTTTATTAAPAGGGQTTAAPATGGGSAATAGVVTIKGFAFGPESLKVAAGTKVTWTNKDPADHTTTADKGGAAPWDSGHLSTGKSFSFTFATKGTYKYHCDIHSQMTGTVEVS